MDHDFLSFKPAKASHRLVLLHGWGADAEDLLPLGRKLVEDLGFCWELISFHAPHIHPQGYGRQWYGLFPPAWHEVPEAVDALQNRFKLLSTPQIPLNRTLLLGFSQGGAMALASGLDLPFAGVVACSAYPHPDWNPPLKRPPVLLSHGKQDEVVPFQASEKLLTLLKSSLEEVQLIPFTGAHSIPEEILPKLNQVAKLWFK